MLDISPFSSQFDEGRSTFSGKYTVELISNFVLSEQLPLVTKFSDETAPKIFGGSIRTHLLAFFPGDDKEYDSEATIAQLKEVAIEFKGQVGNLATPHTL